MFNKLNLNQMNRVVKISMLMAITIVAMMIPSGCTGDEIGKLESDWFDGKVTAKVESANVTTVRAVIDPQIVEGVLKGAGTDPVNYTGGGFTIQLPQISAEYLKKVSDFIEDFLSGAATLEYSASGAKVTDIEFLGFEKVGSANYLRGFYTYASADGSTTCIFVFADRDVDVTGGKNVKVSLKQGWNRLYISSTMMTTKAPSGLKWQFEPM